MDGCVHAQNRQMDGHKFQKQPTPGGVLSPVKFQTDQTKCLQVKVQKPNFG